MKTDHLMYSSRLKDHLVKYNSNSLKDQSVSGHISKCMNNKKGQKQTVVKSENYEHIYVVGDKGRILILGLVTFFRSVNTSWD